MKPLKVALLSGLLGVLTNTTLMAQCAMCRSTVESTISNGRSMVASQLNIGILYLLVIPYLLVTGIALLWYRNSRKEHGQRLEIASRLKRIMSTVPTGSRF
jgi:hypothetical protein